MKFIFIDAENIGVPAVTSVEASILDKVFVFGKDQNVKTLCHQRLYSNIDNYPSGKDQADFALIGLVSKIASEVTRDQSTIFFELLTDDSKLQQAFEYQCHQCNIRFNIKGKSEVKPNISRSSTEVESLVSDAIKSVGAEDFKLDNVFDKVGLETSVFNTEIEKLKTKGILKRTSKKKSLWKATFPATE
ncbi:hypothetical protein BCU68_12195 [Vibrio sp. 10N.286.49.B3]|uniref:hypothetical protein n=1 Tax=Vibrio sp. 10N.286.49.B3 TaxID=1880855 RepID=UPI000C848A55|nr:hypothetical protein [Vibrio sp. 10N.286.49.B3]PMH44896.1 hypothetical protein BCU68_12195 [Vibrio sp. 10N.286.49.B3]